MLARCSGRARSSGPSRDRTITIGHVAVGKLAATANRDGDPRRPEHDPSLRLARQAGARETFEVPAPPHLGHRARRDAFDLDGTDDGVRLEVDLDRHSRRGSGGSNRLHLSGDRITEEVRPGRDGGAKRQPVTDAGRSR